MIIRTFLKFRYMNGIVGKCLNFVYVLCYLIWMCEHFMNCVWSATLLWFRLTCGLVLARCMNKCNICAQEVCFWMCMVEVLLPGKCKTRNVDIRFNYTCLVFFLLLNLVSMHPAKTSVNQSNRNLLDKKHTNRCMETWL